MNDDLGLSSDQYSLALVIFFISYVIFEIPSNLILSRTRPSIYIPAIMALWGAVTCCMALVRSAGALMAVRFVLGILEAGFAPGIMLILSSWYKKDEQAKRFTIFYSAAVLSGAFGGIIAGAITGSLNGARGYAGWQWLFVSPHVLFPLVGEGETRLLQSATDCRGRGHHRLRHRSRLHPPGLSRHYQEPHARPEEAGSRASAG